MVVGVVRCKITVKTGVTSYSIVQKTRGDPDTHVHTIPHDVSDSIDRL